MNSTGLFLPLLIGFFVAVTFLLGLMDRWLEPKSSYRKWLEKRLEEYPDYINWLKCANGGRDYKLGLKILAKLERDKNNSYKKWLKRMRKIGKY